MTGLIMGKNNTPKLQQQPEDEKKNLTHEQLLSCLYFVRDMFDHTELDMFLVKDTAQKVIDQKNLEGDHIDVGVRRLEWNPDTKTLLYAVLQNDYVVI